MTRRHRLAGLPLVAALVSAWSAGAARAQAREPVALVWQRVPDRSAGEGVTAVAADPERGVVAFGNEQGVWLRRGGAGFARVAGTARVNDLAFDAHGRLWIATDDGLWRRDPDGPAAARLRRLAPAPGESARRIARLAVAGDVVVVATDLGAYASRDGERFRAVDAGVPSGAADAPALAADGSTLWLVVGRRLWRVSLGSRHGEVLAHDARAEALLAPGAGEAPVDVASDPGAALVAVFPHALAVRESGGAPFALHRPVLPPGASARRLAFARGRYWLATDRGLLEAVRLEGPWRRAAAPAGVQAAYALASAGGELFAATRAGLLVGRVGTATAGAARPPVAPAPVPPPAPRPGPPPPRDPPVRAVQRAALAYLSLDPSALRRLRRGLAVRGLLPEVDLRYGTSKRHAHGWQYDESFVSGGMHSLHDWDDDRQRDRDYAIVLSWDLRSLAYDPEMVDVSDEARRLIQLRDDVLDEVNQLYFERQRVLLEAAGLESTSPDRARLRLRAAELAAGLDAWTGGWFGRATGSTP